MPRIVIKHAQVDERQLKDGKILRSQMAELDIGNGYGLPFRVGLGTRAVYPVGHYDIDPRSFALSQYGDLTLSRFVDLVPVPAEKKAV